MERADRRVARLKEELDTLESGRRLLDLRLQEVTAAVTALGELPPDGVSVSNLPLDVIEWAVLTSPFLVGQARYFDDLPSARALVLEAFDALQSLSPWLEAVRLRDAEELIDIGPTRQTLERAARALSRADALVNGRIASIAEGGTAG